ncbi:MAG: arginyl-tRNA synthetase [Sphingobacteriales bacterium]|jgi:arginyl-tRNA synthetase
MTPKFQNKLGFSCQNALKEFYNIEIPVEKLNFQTTNKEFEGDITLVIFPFIKDAKKPLNVIGQELGDFILNASIGVTKFNLVKGFLNFTISDTNCIDFLNEIATDVSFGFNNANNKRIMVEYSSPNTNKPLHLGHIRNILLGYSVSKVLESAGNQVIKANLINDRGIHICKSMVAWQQFGKNETPESSNKKGDKLVGDYYVKFDQVYKTQVAKLIEKGKTEKEAKEEAKILNDARSLLQKWEDNDSSTRKLWETMNNWVYEGFKHTYKSLGVEFDAYYYESNTYLLGKECIQKGLNDGAFFKKEDGSIWVDLTDEGLDEKLLLRADGTSVYITQDIGTAILKFEEHKLDESIYVVGNEQDYHFKVLFLILKKLGYNWFEGCSHLSYGMVDLPSGKMKSREGTVVDADDLIADMVETAKQKTEELGRITELDESEKSELFHTLAMGALKFFLLKVDPKKRILFNPEESIDFQGHTGPFVQYTYARIQALKRKAGHDFDHVYEISKLEEEEKALILHMSRFPAIVQEAANERSPAVIANYTYDLAKSFNRFYQYHAVVDENNAALSSFRIELVDQCGEIIRKGLSLLGINVPDRM